MSLVFTQHKIGKLEVKNRFVHSTTFECMASETGEVTEALIKRYRRLAQGDIGLITPGYMFIDPRGQAFKFQIGIHRDPTRHEVLGGHPVDSHVTVPGEPSSNRRIALGRPTPAESTRS